jgi:hypothetical protein
MTKKDVNGKNPAVAVAAAGTGADEEKIYTLSTGIKARIKPVSAGLIQKVSSQVKDPKVPIFHDEDKGRDIENPLHPDYLNAVQEAQVERAMAGNDALIMFGLELIDPIPDVSEWGPKIRFLGIEFDEDNALEVEFTYKKYLAVGTSDLMLIASSAGITGEAFQEAVAEFQRQEG